MDRLENLLGVHALAVVDRMNEAASVPTEAAALVTLTAHPGHGVGWLSEVLGLTDSGATRLVERLVAQGLLRRGVGVDARARTLQPTAAGRRRASQVLTERSRLLSELLEPLPERDRRSLERILARLVSGLADDRPEALRTCRMCDRRACGGDGAGLCPLEHTTQTSP